MVRSESDKKSRSHLELGRQGEDLAAAFLSRRGFKLVERNFRTRFGEIDLICLKRRQVVFVEVKTRTSSQMFGRPGDAVGPDKRRRLSLAALSFLQDKAWDHRPARFDVLEIIFEGQGHRIEHIEDAFDPVLE